MEDLFPTETGAMFDRTIKRLSLTSDYALSKRLNWPTSQVSQYRSGKRSMDPAKIKEYCDKTGTAYEEALNAAVSDGSRKRRNQTNGAAIAE